MARGTKLFARIATTWKAYTETPSIIHMMNCQAPKCGGVWLKKSVLILSVDIFE